MSIQRVSEPALPNDNQKRAYFVILLFVLFLGVSFALRLGNLLVLLYPAAALALGFFLFTRYIHLYIQFVWWLIFLGPFIRRLIDYQSGYLTIGMLNFTPLAVAFISSTYFFKKTATVDVRSAFPYLICVGSIIYALLIGIVFGVPVNGLINSLVNWSSPIVFGYFIVSNWEIYPLIKREIQKTFLIGALVISLYGIFQFFVAPQWDVFWLITSELGARGTPEPLGIRVWSTMDAPQEFANIMMAGVIIFVSKFPEPKSISATISSLIAILLTLARAAWIGLMAAFISSIILQKGSAKISATITIILGISIVILLYFIEPFSSIIQGRIETFTSLSTDNSANARIIGYGDLASVVFTQIFGNGIGAIINVENTTIAAWDSSVLPMVYQLGIIGSLPYTFGLALLTSKLFLNQPKSLAPFESSCVAICIGILVQLLANFIFTGPIGMTLWTFLSLHLASSLYSQRYRYRSGSY